METIMTCIDQVATGETIKNLIKQNGYTVKDIQNLLGLTYPQTIYKWQNGESLPDYENLFALSKLLNVSIEGLIQHQFIISENKKQANREEKGHDYLADRHVA